MPRLLLIEDNEHILRIYSEKFRHEGFEIVTAVDGELGLERARDSAPDCILLDVMLPKKSGFDVMQELHADPVLSKIPVCILSNRAWPDDINRLLTLGARQFFSKGSATPQQIVQEFAQICGFKRVVIIARQPAVPALLARLKHPQLLWTVVNIPAEAVGVVQRGLPNLVIFDARIAADNVVLIIQRLKSVAQTGTCRTLAITNLAGVVNNADCIISEAQLEKELRPTVFRLLGMVG